MALSPNPYGITLVSFGFRYGIPRANYYFDVNFAKNPAREEIWGFFAQPDHQMRSYVLEQESVATFIDHTEPLLAFLATLDQRQVCAFGCSAGRHRSPIIIDELAERLKGRRIHTQIVHRDSDD